MDHEQQRRFTANVPPPSKMQCDGNLETNWKRFKRQFENYAVASRLVKEADEAYKVAVFFAIAGEEVHEIFDNLKFENEEDRKKYDKVVEALEHYFVGDTHEAFESYRFHTRKQENEETMDAFVAALRKLAKNCNFGDLEERLIRDQVVMGVKEENVREKLLEVKELNLDKCLQIGRAFEASKQQMKSMQEGLKEVQVQKIFHKKDKEPQKHKQSGNYKNKHGSGSAQKCSRCGKFPGHAKANCPAKDAECRKCKKIGHWAKQCRTRIEVGGIVDDEILLGAVINADVSGIDADWHVDIKVTTPVRSRSVRFRMDTGADVTVVPANYFQKDSKLIQKTTVSLFGPGRTELQVVGKVRAVLASANAESEQDLFLIENLKEPLLGTPAIKALQLIGVGAVQEKEENYKEKYPKLFQGLGRMKDTKYVIRLEENAKPFAVAAPRRLSLPMKKKVEEELRRLQDDDIIRPVTNPTDWCAPIVAVPKPNEKIRLCIDFTKLNESVKREYFPLPTTDHLLAQLDGAKVFSKLDCNNGFHQIELDEKSQELTTFITPVGRFCYKRLPFGISSGPEVFHREMSQTLSGIPGVIVDIDDVLVSGRTKKEHDERLEAVLKKLEEVGVTLNDKSEFATESVKFLGQLITPEGIHIDKTKVEAITKFPRPENVSDLRRLLGMVNHVGKFTQNLAETTQPLRDLLKKDTEWHWDTPQEKSFQEIKEKLSSTPVLAHYSAEKPTKVSADASSYGIGGALFQKEGTEWKPVFYASRSLSETEKRYAQVEKETLAVTWCCEKFADYLVGMHQFTIETDHKPLLSLLKTKQLDELTPRIQRFRMRLLRFSYNIEYVPGKELLTADALSRAPSSLPGAHDDLMEDEMINHVHAVIEEIPASDTKMEEIRQEQMKDSIISQVMNYCKLDHWPDFAQKDADLRSYWTVRNDLVVLEGLLLFQSRIVIPPSLQSDILSRLHQGHQGVVKCRALARSCVWWPGLSTQIENLVSKCDICEKDRSYPPEPMKPTDTPEFPWQRVAMDLFELDGNNYLVIVDYYSRWIEVAHMKSTTTQAVIEVVKSIFSRFGIPEVVVSDNGPQFSSRDFLQFSKDYGFIHLTSSPHHHQANGEAERAVRTAKELLKKSDDPYLALLNYRATPLQLGWSPAELLMSRRLRSRIPTMTQKLAPFTQNVPKFRELDTQNRQKQKEHFDRRHRAREMSPLTGGEKVWVKPGNKEAVVTAPQAQTPRSVLVNTSRGALRRNRGFLRHRGKPHTPVSPRVQLTMPRTETRAELGSDVPIPDTMQNNPGSTPEQLAVPGLPEANLPHTRSGRMVKRPQKLDL